MANKKKSTTKPTRKTTSKVVKKTTEKPVEKDLLDLVDNTNKKMGKDDIKQKIDLLTADLDDITSNKTKKVEEAKEKSSEVAKKVGNAWLEEQIEGLTAEVAKYERKYLEMKADYEKLLQSKLNQTSDPNVNDKIIQLYRELADNYNGRNATRQRWENVRIDYLLNKLKTNFDFIK
jgi:hypothetical protein